MLYYYVFIFKHCSTMSYLQRPAATSGLMHGPYEESSEDEDGPPPFLTFGTTAVQIMDPRYKRSLELDQYPPPNATKRRKFHNPQGSATIGRYATAMVSYCVTNVTFNNPITFYFSNKFRYNHIGFKSVLIY